MLCFGLAKNASRERKPPGKTFGFERPSKAAALPGGKERSLLPAGKSLGKMCSAKRKPGGIVSGKKSPKNRPLIIVP